MTMPAHLDIFFYSLFSLYSLRLAQMCVHYHTNPAFTPAYAMSIHALISDHVYTKARCIYLPSYEKL